MISMITEREKICYMIGTLGDSTKKESLEALKFLTSLNQDEILKVFDEIIEFNNLIIKEHSENNN